MARVVRTKKSDPAVQERRGLVVALRRQHLSFEEIGKRLDPPISGAAAHKIYRDALEEYPVQQIEEHRQEQLALMNTATAELLKIAADPEVSPRTKVEAWNSLRGWSDSQRKMLGIDMPERLQVLGPEQLVTELDKEIIRLETQLKAKEIASGLPQRG